MPQTTAPLFFTKTIYVMKKILFILMMLMPMVAGAKEYELYCSIGDVSTGGPFLEDSNVRFEFEYRYLEGYFLRVKVINKTDRRITIEWENAMISGEQICFDTDNIYSYNNPKPDEVVHANSSAYKKIGERKSLDYRSILFEDDFIKKHGESVCHLIIPVKFPSGEIIDYDFYVCARFK